LNYNESTLVDIGHYLQRVPVENMLFLDCMGSHHVYYPNLRLVIIKSD